LRRDNCQLEEYEAWFHGECTKPARELGFPFVGPFTSALGQPDSPPWDSDFAIIFPDDKYVRVGEYYRPLPRKEGGGGCLQDLAYHYGPCSKNRDEDGFPNQMKKCDLRIDIDRRYQRHIHYMNEDHIPESRLLGLYFDNIDPFRFIRAVDRHRASGEPLQEILGFKVEPAK
jgi:hypothetical protein